jgi:glycosyltransferase involved in cell wall biosynthesis
MADKVMTDKKHFLTVFPRLDHSLLHKDVGSIPLYLARQLRWRCSIAFFESEDAIAGWPKMDEYRQYVTLIPLGQWRGKAVNALRLLKLFMTRGREFDVVNFYHDSVKNMAYALMYKLFNPRGLVYFKLDMSHLELNLLEENRHKKVPNFVRSIKSLFSRIAVDLYTVETTFSHQALADDRYFKGRIHYLPNGFTGPQDVDNGDIADEKENIILTVGNLGAYPKYSELLVDAISIIDKELVKDWKVYLVGPVVNADFYKVGYKKDHTFEKYLENVTSRYPHLRGTFVFTGKIEDKNRLFDMYRKAKIFCLTSRYESFGFVMLEAMYFGNYVISSDFPASRDITSNGTIGSLFPVGDVQRLAELLSEAMAGNVDLSENGRRAHEFVQNNFDWESIVMNLDIIIGQLTAQSPEKP